MDPRLRARMVFHGAVVVMLGLLAGFPHAFVLTGQIAGEERAWRMAHLEGLLNGMLVMIAAAVSGSLVLSARQHAWLVWSLVAAAYGNVVASVLGATFGVRGLALAGPPANAIMNLLFWVAIVGVLVGVGLLIVGARARAARAREPRPSARAAMDRRPLDGVTLATIVTELVEHYGFAELGTRIDIKCFQVDPSITSSLTFLRRTPWARAKVEDLYLRRARAAGAPRPQGRAHGRA